MEQNTLLNYPTELRTAYLAVLAGIATADHENSKEEIAFIEQMGAAAQIPADSWTEIENALRQPTQLSGHLQSLKDSDLKFALMADVLNLCYADGEMDEEEVQQIAQITQALGISQAQFETLTQYVQKANSAAEQQEGNPGMMGLLSGGGGAGIGDFLSQSGLMGMFQQNNIPTQNFQSGSTIGTVLTGLATQFIQSKMSGQAGGQTGAAGGGLGGMVGAMLGGNTANTQGAGGGLGGMVSGFLSSPQGQQAISGLVSQVMGGQKQGQGLGNLTNLLGGGTQQRRQQANTGQGGLGALMGALLGG